MHGKSRESYYQRHTRKRRTRWRHWHNHDKCTPSLSQQLAVLRLSSCRSARGTNLNVHTVECGAPPAGVWGHQQGPKPVKGEHWTQLVAPALASTQHVGALDGAIHTAAK
jgi:hypothetical protein